MKSLALSFVIMTFTLPAFSWKAESYVVDNRASTNRECPLSPTTQTKHMTPAEHYQLGGVPYSCSEHKFNGDHSKTFYYDEDNGIVLLQVSSDCENSGRELLNHPTYFTVRGSNDCSEKFVDFSFREGSYHNKGVANDFFNLIFADQDSDVSEAAAKELFEGFQAKARTTCNDLNRSATSQVEVFNKSTSNGWFAGKYLKIKIHFEARCRIQE